MPTAKPRLLGDVRVAAGVEPGLDDRALAASRICGRRRSATLGRAVRTGCAARQCLHRRRSQRRSVAFIVPRMGNGGRADGTSSSSGARSGSGTSSAVDDVSFTIREGEFFSMLGPSGCGKTTTLRMIAGFEEPTEGRILLQGGDVTLRAAGQAQRQHGLPGLRAVPAHDRVRERRVRAAHQEGRPCRGRGARRGGDALGAPRGHGGAQAGPALRRPAAARRPRARARQPARGPAARRAARRARPEAAQGDAARAQGDPDAHADDVRLRHARPGRGAHDERPHRRHERRRRRADRRAARALRAPGDSVRRRLHRHLEPAPPARRPRRGRPRRP